MDPDAIIYLSQASLDDRTYVGRHYISYELAKTHRFYFVEREPSWKLWVDLRAKLRPMSKVFRVTMKEALLHSYTPFLKIPFDRSVSLISRLNQWALLLQIKLLVKREKIHNPVFLTSVHNSSIIMKHFPESYKAYIVYDDVWGYEWSGKRSLVVDEEIRTCRSVNDIFACSKGLVRKFEQAGFMPTYLPHAVDTSIFSTRKQYSVPPDLQQIRERYQHTCLFFGKLRSIQVDYGLLKEIILSNPQVGFVAAGTNLDLDLTSIGASNFHFIGEKDHRDLPAYIFYSDSVVIPYNVTSYTEKINSIKVLQALAMGKPVIATPFNEEICALKDMVHLFQNAEQFSNAIRNVMNEGGSWNLKRMNYARLNNWAERAKVIEAQRSKWLAGAAR